MVAIENRGHITDSAVRCFVAVLLCCFVRAGLVKPQTKMNVCTKNAPYKYFCEADDTWRLETQPTRWKTCKNPADHLGGAAGYMETSADSICTAITKAIYCDGKKLTNVGAGHGHCKWFTTPRNQNRCASIDFDCAAIGNDVKLCGGTQDSFPDGSHGRCTMCNGKCVNKSPDNQCSAWCTSLSESDCYSPDCRWRVSAMTAGAICE